MPRFPASPASLELRMPMAISPVDLVYTRQPVAPSPAVAGFRAYCYHNAPAQMSQNAVKDINSHIGRLTPEKPGRFTVYI